MGIDRVHLLEQIMGKISYVLSLSYLSNTIGAYIFSAVSFVLVLWLLYFLRKVVFKKLEELSKKTETDIDDLAVKLIKKIKSPEYQILAFYFAVKNLNRSASFDHILKMVLIIFFTYRTLTIAEEIFSYWLEKLQKDKKNPVEAIGSVKIIFRLTIWLVAILFILHNAGAKIGTLLTSLGIGGVAVALAAQTILGDIFNFFVILLDKPFTKGDFIVLGGNISGTVEEIGLKSVKIRSLAGELITVTNTKVFADIIQNYAQMKERRVLASVGVVYRTPLEKLQKIPQIIKESVEKFSNTRFDRANMSKFGAYSIDFEFVYYLTDANYSFYMSCHEKILREIFSRFAGEGIEFAYPTQTLIIEK